MIELKDIRLNELNKCKYTLFIKGGAILPKSATRLFKKKKLNTVSIKNLNQNTIIENADELCEQLLKCDFDEGVLVFHDGKYDYINAIDFKSLKKLYRIIRWRRNPIERAIRKFNKKEYEFEALMQLSDLHLKNRNDVYEANYVSLLKEIEKEKNIYDHLHVLITGDMVDSPNDESARAFNTFKGQIENLTQNNVYTVPGNHDVNAKGLAIGKKKRSEYSEANEYPRIELIPDLKIALILFNSNEAGQLLARGLIGEKQLKSASEKYNYFQSTGLKDGYTPIAVLHHHLVPYKPEGYKESFIKRLIQNDKTLLLDDSEEFMKWLKIHDIHYVLHGHKHIPYVIRENNINIISCGSSAISTKKNDEEDPFINYNIILNKKDEITLLQCFIKDNKKDINVYHLSLKIKVK